MYKYDDGTHLVGYGSLFGIVCPQFVGSHEGESHYDHHPKGFSDRQ